MQIRATQHNKPIFRKCIKFVYTQNTVDIIIIVREKNKRFSIIKCVKMNLCGKRKWRYSFFIVLKLYF